MAEEVLAQKLNIKAQSKLSQSADPTTQATHPLIRISEPLNLPNFPLLHQYCHLQIFCCYHPSMQQQQYYQKITKSKA